MCGICGIITTDNNVNLPLEQMIDPMLDRMTHRGPDGKGFWTNIHNNVGFGHARLAIVDTSAAGNQPMHLKHLHLVVNGEIYNYPELRKNLEDIYQAQFSSHCDSEIILHGYFYEGIEFVKKLNGMFAFSLFDEMTHKIYFVRDRAGIKPLYYCQKNGQFAFSSEIKSLLSAFTDREWRINPQALSEYLTYQTPLEDRTFFSDVYLLQPGHCLTLNIENGTYSQMHLIEISDQAVQNIDFKDATISFAKIFQQSIKRHLLSDVPISTYISAGFDSASVAVTAAKISEQKNIGAYTGYFPEREDWYNETITAAVAVNNFGGKHSCIPITADDFKNNIDAVIDSLDEPKMGMGAFSQYIVAKEVAKEYKVILTGHGGDELFSGYPLFKITKLSCFKNLKLAEIPHIIYFFLSTIKKIFAKEYGRYMPVLWSLKTQRKLMGSKSTIQKPWQVLEKIHKPLKSEIDKIYQTYLKVYLPGLLIVEDKISMAHALESRTPMLDNTMLDLSHRISQEVKMHDGQLKALIKENAKNILPEIYFSQPKRGFPTPLRHWLRTSLKNILRERLLSDKSYITVLFDPVEIEKQVYRFENSIYRYIRPLDEIQTHRMWQLLSLESWLKTWQEKYNIRLFL